VDVGDDPIGDNDECCNGKASMLIILVVDIIAKYITPPISISLSFRLSSFAALLRVQRLVDEAPILLRILFALPIIVVMNLLLLSLSLVLLSSR